MYSARSAELSLRNRLLLVRVLRLWPLAEASWYTFLLLNASTTNGPSHLGCILVFRFKGLRMTRSPMRITLPSDEVSSCECARRSNDAWYFLAALVRYLDRFWTCF